MRPKKNNPPPLFFSDSISPGQRFELQLDNGHFIPVVFKQISPLGFFVFAADLDSLLPACRFNLKRSDIPIKIRPIELKKI